MFVNDLFSRQSNLSEEDLKSKLMNRVGAGIAKGINPALMAASLADTAQQAKAGDYLGAGLSAGSALAFGAGAKYPPIAAPAAAVGTAFELADIVRDPETREELKQVIKDPFQSTKEYPTSPSQRGRGAGRNVLPAGPPEVKENKEQIKASPELIGAIKDVESGNNPAAISPKGARGTMQVMPGTARDPGFGVTPAQNYSSSELERVGTDYFNAMLNKYGGDKRMALIAYNMGPAAADQWLAKGADPKRLPRETQDYVPKVMGKYTGASKDTGALQVAQPKSVLRQPVLPGPKTTTADYDWNFTPSRGKGKINPNWTPPPGPKLAPPTRPEQLDVIIRQKDRPDSIEDIIKKAKKQQVSLIDLNNFLTKYGYTGGPISQEIYSYFDDDTDKSTIAENNNNIQTLVDQLYTKLMANYGDLVNLYGHEVFGDAIEQIALNHKLDDNPDFQTMAKEVLKLLKSRFEQDESNSSKEEQNAVIQIQADLDKIKNTLDIKESKIYFNVLATPDYELKSKFGMKKDKKGWYLKENTHPTIQLDAMRAFSII